jgi:hypothetical protein
MFLFIFNLYRNNVTGLSSNPQKNKKYLSALDNNSTDKILCHGYVIIEWFLIYKRLIVSCTFMSCLCHYQHYYIDY